MKFAKFFLLILTIVGLLFLGEFLGNSSVLAAWTDCTDNYGNLVFEYGKCIDNKVCDAPGTCGTGTVDYSTCISGSCGNLPLSQTEDTSDACIDQRCSTDAEWSCSGGTDQDTGLSIPLCVRHRGYSTCSGSGCNWDHTEYEGSCAEGLIVDQGSCYWGCDDYITKCIGGSPLIEHNYCAGSCYLSGCIEGTCSNGTCVQPAETCRASGGSCCDLSGSYSDRCQDAWTEVTYSCSGPSGSCQTWTTPCPNGCAGAGCIPPTAPSPPTWSTPNHTDNTVSSINWDWNGSTGASYYKIYKADETLIEVLGDTTEYNQTGLASANTQYGVKVKACDGDGDCSDFSTAAWAYTSANMPTAGSHMIGQNSIIWTWSSGGAQSGFQLYKEDKSTLLTDTILTFFNEIDLIPDTAYTRYLRSYNGAYKALFGPGDTSEWVKLEATTASNPLPVADASIKDGPVYVKNISIAPGTTLKLNVHKDSNSDNYSTYDPTNEDQADLEIQRVAWDFQNDGTYDLYCCPCEGLPTCTFNCGGENTGGAQIIGLSFTNTPYYNSLAPVCTASYTYNSTATTKVKVIDKDGGVGTDSVLVTVIPTPTYVIDPASASKQVGQTQQFIGWYDPDGPSGPQGNQDKTTFASWDSSNTSIATISSGLASCVATGSVTITSVYSSITATASLSCIEPPLPDLIIQGSGVSPNLVTGDALSFSGNIKNQGNDNAGPSYSRLRIDINNNGDWDVAPPDTTNQSTNALGIGEIDTDSWSNAWIAQTGTHKYEICADIEGAVSESNEDNNCSSQVFTVIECTCSWQDAGQDCGEGCEPNEKLKTYQCDNPACPGHGATSCFEDSDCVIAPIIKFWREILPKF